MLSNPIPYHPYRRSKKYKGKFQDIQEAYDDYQFGIKDAGHRLNKIIWDWMRQYEFNYTSGFTLMHQHPYLAQLEYENYENIDWDEDGPVSASEEINFDESLVYLSKTFDQLGIDAPLLLFVSRNPDMGPSDMSSILEVSPQSNRMIKFQGKLFPDDPHAEEKMVVVLEKLRYEFRRHLAQEGYELSIVPVPGTVTMNKAGYKAIYYRVYPIHLKGVKTLIPWLG
jgi:hypothetical protein